MKFAITECIVKHQEKLHACITRNTRSRASRRATPFLSAFGAHKHSFHSTDLFVHKQISRFSKKKTISEKHAYVEKASSLRPFTPLKVGHSRVCLLTQSTVTYYEQTNCKTSCPTCRYCRVPAPRPERHSRIQIREVLPRKNAWRLGDWLGPVSGKDKKQNRASNKRSEVRYG